MTMSSAGAILFQFNSKRSFVDDVSSSSKRQLIFDNVSLAIRIKSTVASSQGC